jgi:hypothetical protein
MNLCGHPPGADGEKPTWHEFPRRTVGAFQRHWLARRSGPSARGGISRCLCNFLQVLTRRLTNAAACWPGL